MTGTPPPADNTPGVESWVPADAMERLAEHFNGTIRPRPKPVSADPDGAAKLGDQFWSGDD